MKTEIHHAALPGQFRVAPAADHPGIPFGVTSCVGDTHNTTFSVFCLVTSFPVPVSEGKRVGTAHGSLGSGKTNLQHLALCVLTT